MNVNRFIVVAFVAAIPLWYVYRTSNEKRTNRLTWQAFMPDFVREDLERAAAKRRAEEQAAAEKAREEAAAAARVAQENAARLAKQAAERVNQCRQGASRALAAYDSYVVERGVYHRYTESLLEQEIPQQWLVKDYEFQAAFKRLYVPASQTSEAEKRQQRVKHLGERCAKAGAQEVTSDEDIKAIEADAAYFENGRARLLQSRRDLELIMQYITRKLPSTLRGELLKSRALDLIYPDK